MSNAAADVSVLPYPEKRAPDIARLVLGVDGMYSRGCARRIERILQRLPGLKAEASYASGTLKLVFDRTQCPLPGIVAQLDELGYRVRFDPSLARDYSPNLGPVDRLLRLIDRVADSAGAWVSANGELLLIALAGALLLSGAIVHWMHGPAWVRIALLAMSAACSSIDTFREALATVRAFRIDVDVLMFAAAAGAATLGKFEEGALLLFLFGLGSAGERVALGRARKAISALTKVVPETALLIGADGNPQSVPVDRLKVEDRIVVRPFDRVGADGRVVEGASSIDQSAITGESVPVEKKIDDDVFAGTINGEGRLIVRVTKLASDTTLAKIIRLVEEAQTTKSPTQLFTDEVEKYYVPSVFIATTLLIFVPPLFLGTWGVCFYRAMAFLTAASPCALAIGTPAAILCGIARAARDGVLIKGGVHLENLGAVRAIAFDKTGTLTSGRLTLIDVIPMAGMETSELLALASAIERNSSHPLASAITKYAKQQLGELSLQAADIEQRPALGAVGSVNGCRIAVGKRSLIDDVTDKTDEIGRQIERLASEGKAIVAVGRDGKVIGLLALADEPRANAKAVIARLHQLGIRHAAMLTGDNATAANAVAERVGVDQTYADLLPDDKLKILGDIAREHGPVAMIGDGVNDAPALAQATVGIAMGAAGSDVAIETANVVLMSSDLAKLPQVIALSRFARLIIKQNLVIALGVIGVVAPLAALGFANLGVAVMLHEGSTVVVVCNALRLLRFQTAAATALTG